MFKRASQAHKKKIRDTLLCLKGDFAYLKSKQPIVERREGDDANKTCVWSMRLVSGDFTPKIDH